VFGPRSENLGAPALLQHSLRLRERLRLAVRNCWSDHLAARGSFPSGGSVPRPGTFQGHRAHSVEHSSIFARSRQFRPAQDGYPEFNAKAQGRGGAKRRRAEFDNPLYSRLTFLRPCVFAPLR
jgi:hypothetical protein